MANAETKPPPGRVPDDAGPSPDSLMTPFSRSPIVRCLLVAIVAHAAIIAATSAGYIRDRWIDPGGAERRLAEQDRVQQEAADLARRARAAAATQPAARLPARRPRDPADSVPDRARGSDIYRSTTQSADPGEIPREPEIPTLLTP